MSIGQKFDPVICNTKCLQAASTTTSEEMPLVRDVVSEYFRYISVTIKRGAFEAVEVPFFGRFQAKLKMVQRVSYNCALPWAFEPKQQPDTQLQADEPVQVKS